MNIQFNKRLISSINNIHPAKTNKNADMSNNNKMAVPSKKTFNYILKNAKNGNEMAAVQLDEWQKSCVPQNDKEKQIVKMINNAVDEILK